MADVYVVHCIDTEGPLHESLEATFGRIKDVCGIELNPSIETLHDIQDGKLELNGYEKMLSMAFSKRLLDYNDDWSSLYRMLDNMTSKRYRMQYQDSYGGGWNYTWFILDFADFLMNPRGKTFGYHAILDKYLEYYRLHNIQEDEFQWHAHPMSAYKEANRCGTSYLNSPHILQSLARRLIDRGMFPDCFRAGFHTERADSHWFLEQYIPYDFSNQAIDSTADDDLQKDLSGGRFGDWRRADASWAPYHPSHDDYQKAGSCNRVIFRCLNAGTRLRLITQDEVNKAFQRADEGEDTVLAFCDHDFRNMTYDVEEVYTYLQEASAKYPKVKWINSTASKAAKKVLKEPCSLAELTVTIEKEELFTCLRIKANIESFGSQPFFALKKRSGEYVVENLDIQVPNRQWTFIFDDDSIKPDDIELIGIAFNSRKGSGCLSVTDMQNKVYFYKKW